MIKKKCYSYDLWHCEKLIYSSQHSAHWFTGLPSGVSPMVISMYLNNIPINWRKRFVLSVSLMHYCNPMAQYQSNYLFLDDILTLSLHFIASHRINFKYTIPLLVFFFISTVCSYQQTNYPSSFSLLISLLSISFQRFITYWEIHIYVRTQDLK